MSSSGAGGAPPPPAPPPKPAAPLSGGSADSIGDRARLGVLTISDRASAGVYDDLSGPAILQFFHDVLDSPWEAVYRVIPDERPLIEQAIIDLVCVWGGGGTGAGSVADQK